MESEIKSAPKGVENPGTHLELKEENEAKLREIFEKMNIRTIFADGKLSLDEVDEFASVFVALSEYERSYLAINMQLNQKVVWRIFKELSGFELSKTNMLTRAYSQVEFGDSNLVDTAFMKKLAELKKGLEIQKDETTIVTASAENTDVIENAPKRRKATNGKVSVDNIEGNTVTFKVTAPSLN